MISPIRPEQLKHRITIKQQPVDYEQPVENWPDFATNIFAFVDPTGGSEFYAAQKINSEATGNIWIRYKAGVLSSMKVVYGARIFDIIVPINLQEANRWLRLICKELI